MTTFDSLATSRESSRPFELYKFVLGTEEFFFTSAEDDITVGIDVFVATEGLSRTRIVQGADQSKRGIIVTMPADEAFAQKYRNNVPGEQANFSLFQLEREEVPAQTTQLLLFSGLVQSVEFPNDGQSAAVTIQSLESALSQNLPRVTFSGACGNFLYDEFCGANPDLFNHTGVVTLVSGSNVTVTGLGAAGFAFVGGYARPTAENDYRLVIAHSGDVLTLLFPFENDPTGGSVQAFAGCDHLIEGDCALVFDRVIDFMGFAFVPNRNVFEVGAR